MPTVAHSPDERVERGSIERSWNVIDDLLTNGLDAGRPPDSRLVSATNAGFGGHS